MSQTSVKVKGIVEYNGKYLLVQRWYDDNILTPFRWEFIDSDVESPKGPDETVIDSVETGFGLEVVSSKLLYTWHFTVGDTFYVGIAYHLKVDSDIAITLDENSKYIWVSPDEITQYIEDTRLLEDLRKNRIIKRKNGKSDDLILTI